MYVIFCAVHHDVTGPLQIKCTIPTFSTTNDAHLGTFHSQPLPTLFPPIVTLTTLRLATNLVTTLSCAYTRASPFFCVSSYKFPLVNGTKWVNIQRLRRPSKTSTNRQHLQQPYNAPNRWVAVFTIARFPLPFLSSGLQACEIVKICLQIAAKINPSGGSTPENRPKRPLDDAIGEYVG